jgi:hypothetical protein
MLGENHQLKHFMMEEGGELFTQEQVEELLKAATTDPENDTILCRSYVTIMLCLNKNS